MAIEIDNGQNNGQKQTAQTTGGQQAQPQGQGDTWSFHNASGLFAAPIAQGVGSEWTNKLAAGLKEAYAQANQNVALEVFIVDNSNVNALAYSTIGVALQQKNKPELGVAWYILLVESSGMKLTPRIETINNQPVEITQVPGDAVDAVLIKIMAEEVRKLFPQSRDVYTGAMVVPADFVVDDKASVHNLALNAGLATNTELTRIAPGFPDYNLAKQQKDSNLGIDIAFNRNDRANIVGEPTRSDVEISFCSRKRNGNQGQNAPSLNSGDKERTISKLSGFMDVLYAPSVPQTAIPGMMYAQPGVDPRRKFAARLVLTDVTTNFSLTPACVMLAVATASSLAMDGNWMQAFRPTPTPQGEVDLYDVGALNVEANYLGEQAQYGQVIDTKTDTFTLPDLGQYLATIFHPGMLISIDVPEAGPQSWYLEMFAQAAAGNQNAQKAVLKAANDLTNGAFDKYFDRNAPLFLDVGNRVHLGNWVDRSGQKKDIRHIDYLAVANLMSRQPDVIRDWSDTWTRTQYPLNQRLAARKKMISALTGETAEFRGFAQRVTFSHQFIDALIRACADAGLAARTTTPLSINDLNNQRGVASFVQQGLVIPQNSFMTSGFAYQPQYVQQQYAGYGRF